MTASAAEHNFDFVCIQEHRYYHSELEIKYHDTDDGRTFVSLSVWKNSVNAVTGEGNASQSSYPKISKYFVGCIDISLVVLVFHWLLSPR